MEFRSRLMNGCNSGNFEEVRINTLVNCFVYKIRKYWNYQICNFFICKRWNLIEKRSLWFKIKDHLVHFLCISIAQEKWVTDCLDIRNRIGRWPRIICIKGWSHFCAMDIKCWCKSWGVIYYVIIYFKFQLEFEQFGWSRLFMRHRVVFISEVVSNRLW